MWLTLIFAETIAAQSGVGYMAMQAREFMQIDVIVLSILLYALLGKGADTLVKVLERWRLGRRPAFPGENCLQRPIAPKIAADTRGAQDRGSPPIDR